MGYGNIFTQDVFQFCLANYSTLGKNQEFIRMFVLTIAKTANVSILRVSGFKVCHSWTVFVSSCANLTDDKILNYFVGNWNMLQRDPMYNKFT